jgi:NeuB family
MKPLTTKNSPGFRIGERSIGNADPVYFVADIAANHDGDLERAKDLIYLAKESGADAAKFQHFAASTIVSDYEFRKQQNLQSHQSNWKKSVFEVYSAASVDLNWTPILKETCDKAGIEFMTSPYSYALVDHIDPFLNAYKIGSGDITWIDYLRYVAKKNKPLLLATGAMQHQLHGKPGEFQILESEGAELLPRNVPRLRTGSVRPHAGSLGSARRRGARCTHRRETLHRFQRPRRPRPQVFAAPRQLARNGGCDPRTGLRAG